MSKLRLISEFQANGKHVCVFTVSELSCSHQPVCCGYSRQNAEQWPVREQRGCGGWNNGLKALPRTPALSCVLNPQVLTVSPLTHYLVLNLLTSGQTGSKQWKKKEKKNHRNEPSYKLKLIIYKKYIILLKYKIKYIK